MPLSRIRVRADLENAESARQSESVNTGNNRTSVDVEVKVQGVKAIVRFMIAIALILVALVVFIRSGRWHHSGSHHSHSRVRR